MTFKRIALAFFGCCIAASTYLLNSEAPAPDDAATGQPLSDFSATAPADPPANFSVDMRAHMEAGSLHVEKLEFFHATGEVHTPTITKTAEGTLNVHVWVARPLVELIGTKCEFVRTIQFSIPKSELVNTSRLRLVNHDTGTVQVLAEAEALGRLLREPDRPASQSKSQENIAATGGGC